MSSARKAATSFASTAAQAAASHPSSTSRGGSSKTTFWTPDRDNLLEASRNAGLDWNAIATQHFPSHTGNACRKRHERITQRKKVMDWEGPRMDRLAALYIAKRKGMWQPLAEELGERWQVIEGKVMEKGLKAIISTQKVAGTRKSSTSTEGDSGVCLNNDDGPNGIEAWQDDVTTDKVPARLSTGHIYTTYETSHPGMVASWPSLSSLTDEVAARYPRGPMISQPSSINNFPGRRRPMYTGPPIPSIQAPPWSPGVHHQYLPYSASTFEPPPPYGGHRPY